MRIRWKLMVLLLTVALLPLIGTSLLHRLSARGLGRRLAADTRQLLIEDARQDLLRLADSYVQLQRANGQSIELALRLQAAEIERRLAAPLPSKPRIITSAEYDSGQLLDGVELSDAPFPIIRGGQLVATKVSYSDQVYILAEGTDRAAVSDDMARLSTMPAAFAGVCDRELMSLQYVTLTSGVHVSYPGRGGYTSFDGRGRPWYIAAVKKNRLTWLPPTVDKRTGQPTVIAAIPVRRPDGSLAGVTGMDMPLTYLLDRFKLPRQFTDTGEIKFVRLADADSPDAGQLVIIVQRSYQKAARRESAAEMELETFQTPDTAQLQAMITDIRNNRGGVRTLQYGGQEVFVAYEPAGAGEPFPVVIVPYDRVVAHATAAEEYVWQQTLDGLRRTGMILSGVLVAVVLVAVIASRNVTRPIRAIAKAGQQLASGDFDAHVDVRTRDELQELAAVFNATGPQLRDRQALKQSLAVAMEVQQNLLPQGPPDLDGFDIHGHILYCDETGGDYFDFIQLVDLGPQKLGIAVGDITGHGIGAALLMAAARGVLRSHAGLYAGDLAELFNALNRHLVRDTGDERFLTLFYAMVDGPTRSITWASGGHDPGLLRRAHDGSFEHLPSSGIPLGIMEDYAYDGHGLVMLQAGDVLVVGTDGIWEAANAAGEMFGKDRYQTAISENAHRPAADIHAAVVAAVTDFRGDAPQTDDITLVVIRAL